MPSSLEITDHIRRVNPHQDILPVADLIELCFSHQMDEDGREYLRHLRRAARLPDLIRWVQGASERVSYPLNGFVYEIDGRVVGNCSIIPFFQWNQWRYLIANVAVHPEFRRQGIGHQLTFRAVRHAQEHDAVAWLQVRDDNPGACKLYQNLGFEEILRRDTWLFKPGRVDKSLAPLGVKLQKRQRADWLQQAEWLAEIFPPDVTWNLPLRIDQFKPSLMAFITDFLMDNQVSHTSIIDHHHLAGVATHQRTSTYADWLWLAINPAEEDRLLPHLLKACRLHASNRNLIINYPAGRCHAAFESTGLQHQNCLIWMRMNDATND